MSVIYFCCGPKGCPNILPQPAWRLVELFFWSNLSWSWEDLCANSYVISMHFCLLSTMSSCTRYISNIRIGRIIHNVLFRISMHGLFVTLDPTDFQVTCNCSYFLSFVYYVQINSYHEVLFLMKIWPCWQIVFQFELFPPFAWEYDNNSMDCITSICNSSLAMMCLIMIQIIVFVPWLVHDEHSLCISKFNLISWCAVHPLRY